MANRIGFEEIQPFLEKNCFITSTVREVLKNLKENYQQFQKVTDEDLLALSSIFGETLEKALEIVEDNKVTYIHTNSDIGVYQVKGNLSNTYTVFPSVNYCSCPSYKYKVSKGSQIICKHALAMVIADAIGKRNSVEGIKMNDREDWNNRNAYMEQCMYPFSGVPPPFGSPPNNWVHVPPQTMPWGLPPESHPSVVRFTAGEFNSQPFSFKRKFDTCSDVSPSKILVTEEKMAAHMRGLHISEVKTSDIVTNMNVKEEPMETERLPRLVISEQIKNLKTEPIIPDSILKKLEKPEMALVLWQPPAADLGSKLRELKKLSIKKEKEKKEEKEDREMDIAIETETETKNIEPDNIFRPIDPVPMPEMPNQYFQPVPQFHGFSPFS